MYLLGDNILTFINIPSTKSQIRSGYPGKLNQVTKGCEFQSLGDEADLTQFGVNRVVLHPGGVTSLRHWHEKEDEFVIIFSGSVILIDNVGERTLEAGDCVGFKANEGNGHQLVNRLDTAAVIFEIASSLDDKVKFFTRNGKLL